MFKLKKAILYAVCSVFIFSCSEKNELLEVKIPRLFQGPVVIVECEIHSSGNTFDEKITIDTFGLTVVKVPSQLSGYKVRILDSENHQIDFAPDDVNGLNGDKKRVFNFGYVKTTGYCEGSDISYVSFYVGTAENYKKYMSVTKGYELDFFNMRGIDFCAYLKSRCK